jgi:26S proteasome regulatory subunit N6
MAQKVLQNADRLYGEQKYDDALGLYVEVLASPLLENTEEDEKLREDAVTKLGKVYRRQGNSAALKSMLTSLRPFFARIPKAKTGKLVRSIIDEIAKIPGTAPLVVELCNDVIKWAEEEQRTFLRLNLQTKLAGSLFEVGKMHDALDLLSKLAREVKKLDDKRLLVTIHLLESHVHHALNHLPKSRAALTAARTAANGIYCPPQLQAQLDIHSGTLHAEEKDYKTAYSYFYEAYENYEAMPSKENKVQAKQCLKYMLLTKIMAGSKDDVSILLSGKLALPYTDDSLSAMVAIAKAHQDSSLRKFKNVIDLHRAELEKDSVIHRHLKELYQKLFEENLLRIVSPFSQVEIPHVAELIELDVPTVEKKLSGMILDKKLLGILDQGNGCLIVFEEPDADSSYPTALDTMGNVGQVVDSLYTRANKLR